MTSAVPVTIQDDEFSEIPTRQQLLNLFNEKRRNNETIPLYELIHLLGGIDVVMNVMMNAPNLKMMETNLQSIHHLLTDQSASRPSLASLPSDAHIITKMMSYSKEMETKQMLRWCLDPHNNYLHETSSFLAKYLYSKQMMVIFTTTVITLLIIRSVAEFWIYNAVAISMIWFIFIPWTIASLMSVNKAMIPRIAATIDTWIKVFMMISAMIYTMIYNVKAKVTDDSQIGLYIAFALSATIGLSMFVVVVSSIDAIHGWGRKTRIFLVTFMALFALFWALTYRYFVDDETIRITALGGFGTISLRERVATCWEIEVIFLTKQAFLVWYRGTERCNAVKYSPYLEWRKTLDADTTLFSRRSVTVTNDPPKSNKQKSRQNDDAV